MRLVTMVISFLNQKGGVGKTTLSLHVAHFLSLKTEKILVVDADPQHSCLDWAEMREGKMPFDVIGYCKKTLHRDLPSIAENYDKVIIDGPPRVNELSVSCIMASDKVFVPCTPSFYDLQASKDILDLIDQSSTFKANLKSAFVINRRITNTAIGRDVEESLTTLGMPVLSTHIFQRVMYAECASLGKTVFDLDEDSKAAIEIENLSLKILEF